jgi:L-lactate dehydrogenase complex protein LldE
LKAALFLPCYVEQLYPKVGMATVKILEKWGVEVDYPREQTCCGQPFNNMGCSDEAKSLAQKFSNTFNDYEYVVCPSGSCTSMVRNHYDKADQTNNVYELCEFLTDVLKVNINDVSFPHKVGLHQSCHGLRELKLANSSEIQQAPFNKVKSLLSQVKDIELVDLKRPDECCGFGGTFAVSEEKLSCTMGNDRILDHMTAGADIITGVDLSCLMHLDGLIRRQKKPLRVMHIAEILAGEIS